MASPRLRPARFTVCSCAGPPISNLMPCTRYSIFAGEPAAPTAAPASSLPPTCRRAGARGCRDVWGVAGHVAQCGAAGSKRMHECTAGIASVSPQGRAGLCRYHTCCCTAVSSWDRRVWGATRSASRPRPCDALHRQPCPRLLAAHQRLGARLAHGGAAGRLSCRRGRGGFGQSGLLGRHGGRGDGGPCRKYGGGLRRPAGPGGAWAVGAGWLLPHPCKALPLVPGLGRPGLQAQQKALLRASVDLRQGYLADKAGKEKRGMRGCPACIPVPCNPNSDPPSCCMHCLLTTASQLRGDRQP